VGIEEVIFEPFCAESSVQSTHNYAVEDVSALNGYRRNFRHQGWKVPFKGPRHGVDDESRIALRLMPEQLSPGARQMRLEFANTKDDTNPALSVGTATIAALVHQFREDGFTTYPPDQRPLMVVNRAARRNTTLLTVQ
jgi:hypothetical protein